MKALQMTKFGVPEDVVELVDVPEPGAPKADEVLAAVEYAPINHSEILKITRRYPLLPSFGPADNRRNRTQHRHILGEQRS